MVAYAAVIGLMVDPCFDGVVCEQGASRPLRANHWLVVAGAGSLWTSSVAYRRRWLVVVLVVMKDGSALGHW